MSLRALLFGIRERASAARFNVNRCLACDAVLPLGALFCDECREAYREECLWECGSCGRKLLECTCVPRHLEAASVHKLIKLLRYRTDLPSAVGNRAVYKLKRYPLMRAHTFFAEELSPSVERLLSSHSSYIVTHVVRTAKQRRKYGFDQSACLAETLAERLGLPFDTPLARKKDSRVQKQLAGAEARAANVRGAFYPREEISLRGKHVLLVDDIVTTGASMAECARVLRRMGAREVIGVSLSVSYRHPNIKYEHDANTREEKFYRKK